MSAAGPPPDIASIIKALIPILFHVRLTRDCLMVAVTILTYDYFITLPAEVKYIWKTKWGWTKVLFLINRYIPFIYAIFLILLTNAFQSPSHDLCIISVHIFAWVSKSGAMVASLIIKTRTWAVWGRRRLITLYLVSEFILFYATDIYVTLRYTRGISYLAANSHFGGCAYNFQNRLIFISYVLFMVSETIAVIMLSIKALQHFRLSRAPLMLVMYRDGIFSFLLILATSILNLIMTLVAPPEIQGLFIGLQLVMHSVLCNRILLNIREAATQGNSTSQSSMFTSRASTLPPLPPIPSRRTALKALLQTLSDEWSARKQRLSASMNRDGDERDGEHRLSNFSRRQSVLPFSDEEF